MCWRFEGSILAGTDSEGRPDGQTGLCDGSPREKDKHLERICLAWDEAFDSIDPPARPVPPSVLRYMGSTATFARAERGIAAEQGTVASQLEARPLDLPPRSDSPACERACGLEVPRSSCYCYTPRCSARLPLIPVSYTLPATHQSDPPIPTSTTKSNARCLNPDTDPSQQQYPASSISASPTSPTYICLASPDKYHSPAAWYTVKTLA